MLSVRNLNFSFAGNCILEKVNFTVKAGEFVGIIGPNGAGKSTLMKLLDGLLTPQQGSIELNDISISGLKRRQIARSVAYVPQEVDFAFAFKVSDIIRMGRFPYQKAIGLYSPEDEKLVNNALIKLEVENFSERMFTELSGGEKQRVIIASALAQNPDILLLDEPTSALDLHHQIAIYKILQILQKQNNITSIVVTHDINLAAQFCDRIIILDKGRIISDGKPKDVLQFQVLQDVFGVKVYIDINPLTDSIYILPYG